MAEELPQNSSGSQVASKDSGVSSEGQLSNQTGESVAVQSNQESQSSGSQNNQNNKNMIWVFSLFMELDSRSLGKRLKQCMNL